MKNKMSEHSYFGTGRIVVLGHRGSPREAPENTLPSFRRALEQGADGVELDVHLTCDGALVVFHNYTLSGTTGSRGFLAKRTLKELKELDAGSSFSREYAGTPIPTFTEVVEGLDKRAFIMIEIKSYLGRANEDVARAVAAAVAKHDLYERAVVSSFNPRILKKVKESDSRIPVGFLHHLPFPGFSGKSCALFPGRLEVLHPLHRIVSARYMERARRLGCRVIPWTVNSAADLQKILPLGVDGVITDYPGAISDALQAAKERGG
ncbi:MAG TPA: glycerophosphodiester phosphodiesterase [Firmicutes bacterium]|jgi:glycerophosphoryl diester phosphodiesterase|nr:glycerophosphodiester phosphodiesterase [Bacillota bacterium]